MQTTTTTTSDTRHVFDHIAPAPYRYIGFERRTYQACHGAPVQVGDCCDHCGTGIIDTYKFRAADGTEFVVGSSCVEKSGDRGLYSQIKRDVNRIKRERQVERDTARVERAKAAFAEHREVFAAMPHPRGFCDRETGEALTMADQVEWMFANAGLAGSVRTARLIEKTLKGA